MIARQYVREMGWLAAGYFVVMQLALVAAVVYWPEIRDNLPSVAKLIPIESLRRMVDSIQEEGYWAYFALQQFFKGVNLFGLAAAAILGTGIVAREADNRTAEFLLSRPVRRRRILLVRWAVGAVFLSAPVFLSTLGGVALSPLIGEDYPRIGPLLAASFYLSLFLIALYTFTVWMSARFDNQLKAGIILVGLGLLQFALYLVKVIGDYSLFTLVDMDVLLPMIAGGFPWLRAAGLTAATGVLLYFAVRKFEQRDF